MEMTTIEVLNRGMECLIKNMGIIEAEQFIAAVMREKFDYTKWQREYFAGKTADQIHEEAVEYAVQNPYKGKAQILKEPVE